MAAKAAANATAREAPKAASKTATPWGRARIVDEIKVAQRAGDKRFASTVQLLESDQGEQMLRIAYTSGGRARRGPVTLRPQDVERLRAAARPGSALAGLLGWSVSEAGGDA
jgi:hypothetical protein